MATITARIPDDKKRQAKRLADELGVSLSTLINMWINDFLRKKTINITLDDTQPWYYEQNSMMVDEPIEHIIDVLQDSLSNNKANE